jgi:hypothetical protein
MHQQLLGMARGIFPAQSIKFIVVTTSQPQYSLQTGMKIVSSMFNSKTNVQPWDKELYRVLTHYY